MARNRQLANLPDAITTDTSNNVGIGGSPSGTYKFEVTGTSYHSLASTFGSTATATAFIPSGATVPTNGMYLSAANTLNFATNTTNRLTIASTGAATFSSSIAATTASFSGTITSTGSGASTPALTNTGAGTNLIYGFYNNTSGGLLWGVESSVGADIFSGTSAYSGVIGTNGSKSLHLATNNAVRVTIDSTGAATFSSSISSSLSGSGSTNFLSATASGTGAKYAYITNTGGQTVYGIENSSGGAVLTGSSAYATVLFSNNATSLQLGTNASVRMTITSVGKVLIATATSGDDIFNVTNSSSSGYGMSVTGGNGATYSFTARNYAGTPLFTVLGNGTATFSTLAGTGSRAVLADASGNLSAPVSDISVKENIKTIGYGINEILKMKPVWFNYNDEYKNYGEGRQNGNIAQEMEAIIPEAVFTTPSTGKMGINYDQLHAVYIKAIQEQQAQIEELKAKTNRLFRDHYGEQIIDELKNK